MKRGLRLFLATTILFVSAHRLPAPIQEIPESPTPPPAKTRSETKTLTKAKSSPTAAAGMRSRSVEVVLTSNTNAAIAYLRKRVQDYESQPLAGKSDVHPDEILQQLRQALSTRFGNVSILDGSSSSGSGGLTMVFDLQAKVGTISFTTNTVSFSATFREGGRTLATIQCSGKSMVPYPGFFGTQFSKAVNQAFADFSQKLRAFR